MKNKFLEKLHYQLHDLYGYLGFLISIPFHFNHDKVCNIFTLRGAMVCEDPCGYCYDRGY